jgi:hypothetical protein
MMEFKYQMLGRLPNDSDFRFLYPREVDILQLLNK